MMARRLPGILPPLTFDEALEVHARSTRSRACCRRGVGLLDRAAVPRAAPHDLRRRAGRRRHRSRVPAKSASRTTACCSSTRCSSSTGTCSKCCASRSRKGVVTIARAARTAVFPARFVLVGAMNPCPCGFLGDPRRGMPLHAAADRRAIATAVGPAARSDRSDRRRAALSPTAVTRRAAAGESSAAVRARVLAARDAAGGAAPGTGSRHASQRRPRGAGPARELRPGAAGAAPS